MLYVDRSALEQAIIAGSNRHGHWRVCRMDGSIYFQSIYQQEHPHLAIDIVIPSLYPDGVGTRFARFCAWARKHEDGQRGRDLIALAYGHVAPINPEGTPWAVPCIVNFWLTANEKAAWESSQAAIVYTLAESCLQELNAIGGRLRYRWRYPTPQPNAPDRQEREPALSGARHAKP